MNLLYRTTILNLHIFFKFIIVPTTFGTYWPFKYQIGVRNYEVEKFNIYLDDDKNQKKNIHRCNIHILPKFILCNILFYISG